MAMGTGKECFETHLIEEDGKLNGDKFDEFLKKVNLAACKDKYAVVSIMGPQSSGKSTLLNHLFGSKFEELDGLQRRGKTTKGIWLARCAGIKPCTLVMDVEGSDGRERQEDTAFERRSGLFAFVVSNIVLINMFAHSVGLEHGASKPLLKEVFQAVLRLSASPRKTTLMFVIRDITERTPLKILDPKLREDIRKIWDSIPKPERPKGTPLSTFFNIAVEGLPNFTEREEQFKEQVKMLRQRINDSIAPGGLAGDSHWTIPGSDFSHHVQRTWKTIKEDRKLDLPKYEVMVARIRCEGIADKMLEDFKANEVGRQLEEGAQTNPATGFRAMYNSINNFYLPGYDNETAYYDADVRSEKRKQLEEKMMLEVQSAFRHILANIRSKSLEEFEEAFNALEKGKDYEKAAQNCKEAYLKLFDDRCAAFIVEQANCNIEEERKKLELAIYKKVLQVDGEVLQVEREVVQGEKGKGKTFAAVVGGAVMATAVIGVGAALGAIFLPVAAPAAGAAAGAVAAATALSAAATALGTLVETVKAYKSKNRKISPTELVD